MKRVFLLFIIFAAILPLFAETYTFQTQKLVINSIDKSYGSDKTGILQRPITIRTSQGSFILMEGKKVTYNTRVGFIEKGTLKKQTVVSFAGNRLVLKAEGRLEFIGDKDGRTGEVTQTLYGADLESDTPLEIGGSRVIARGRGGNRYISDIYFSHDLSGKPSVQSFFCAQDTPVTIQGQNFVFAKGRQLGFYDNKISGGYLQRPVQVKVGRIKLTVRKMRKKDHIPNIRFNRDGSVSSCNPKPGTIINTGKYTLTFPSISCRVYFSRSHAVKRVIWAYPIAVPVKFSNGTWNITPAGSGITFYDSGDIKKGRIFTTRRIFYPDGGRKVPIEFISKSFVSFHPGSIIKSGRLNAPVTLTVKGKRVSARRKQTIYFDKEGKVERIR